MRSVCWCFGASRRPPVRSASRFPSRESSVAGGSSLVRAAASSIASGKPSRRAQSSATAAAFCSRQVEVGVGGLRAADEQLGRLVVGERRDRELALSRNMQRRAARHDDLHLRRRRRADARCVARGRQDLLEVVDAAAVARNRQATLRAALPRPGPTRGSRALRGSRARRGSGSRSVASVATAAPVLELGREPPDELDREPCLADAADAGQRDEARVLVADDVGDRRELSLATEQRRRSVSESVAAPS